MLKKEQWDRSEASIYIEKVQLSGKQSALLHHISDLLPQKVPEHEVNTKRCLFSSELCSSLVNSPCLSTSFKTGPNPFLSFDDYSI